MLGTPAGDQHGSRAGVMPRMKDGMKTPGQDSRQQRVGEMRPAQPPCDLFEPCVSFPPPTAKRTYQPTQSKKTQTKQNKD